MKKEIKWLENVKENKLDSVWYGGDVATIVFDDRYYFTIIAAGDVKLKINSEIYCDKSQTGRMATYLKENGIENDEQLQAAVENGNVVFLDNNWFEVISWDDKKKDYMNDWCGDNVIDLDLNDDFEWLRDWIEADE